MSPCSAVVVVGPELRPTPRGTQLRLGAEPRLPGLPLDPCDHQLSARRGVEVAAALQDWPAVCIVAHFQASARRGVGASTATTCAIALARPEGHVVIIVRRHQLRAKRSDQARAAGVC